MKINWKVRFKNPYFLAAIAGLIAMILGDFGLSTEAYWRYVEYLSYIAVTLGVINDPVVRGIGDSKRALNYKEPREDK
ncbi:phage holin [Paenalkalicoccus suaedae]|uniref:Phage holin n=1 Tax=Paenalkalicoccus suaedae TaxID=2592382 RepID=A0A859FGA4_9BACI|nr:phage holin [Paenalkalicoccus suaedae]QKS71649.1 phage holin [Paenalkalicoccus suaedae]QKS71702.1 phage holin [Paenalkalicoccus suaedae]